MDYVLVEYRNIHVDYENKKIINNFNLKIKKGDKILFKGRSGSGKSTLLKLIMGFSFPSEGLVYFNGNCLDCYNIWDVREQVCYISQYQDVWEGPVANIFGEIFSYRKNIDKFDRKKLEYFLEYFDLDYKILQQNYDELSGGEKQRICIIIALLLDRDIYLLDEITSSLDQNMKEKVINYFVGNKDWTLIVASHDNQWEMSNMEVINIGD